MRASPEPSVLSALRKLQGFFVLVHADIGLHQALTEGGGVDVRIGVLIDQLGGASGGAWSEVHVVDHGRPIDDGEAVGVGVLGA